MMKTISKALVWYPSDKTVRLARMWRCGECGTPIVVYASQVPKAVTLPNGKHGHVAVSAEPSSSAPLGADAGDSGSKPLRLMCRCLEIVGDEPSCPKHGVKEIPVIFRD